ncbi:MAG: glycosyltransferase family 4 protein [Candidatus Cloacimonetes bacterium]|nr:glycosyltransferase family 4 protein [Candidatus Cloacimonadota bacterium]
MKKLLLVSAYTSPFIQTDQKILSRHYLVKHVGIQKHKKNPFSYLLLVFTLGWEVFHTDIVYCWFSDFRARAAVFYAKLFGKRSLVLVGGYELQNYALEGDSIGNLKYVSHLRYCLQNADIVAALSDFYRQKLESLNIRNKCELHTLYIAVPSPSLPKILNKHNLVITVCAGDTEKRIRIKGIDVFVKTAALLPQVEFAIIGPGRHLAEAIKRLITSENVKIIPPLSSAELAEYYLSARIYCQFSRFESFGSAVVEAMMCQCLPVVSDIPALRERVDKFGLILKDWDEHLGAELIAEALKAEPDKTREAAEWVKSMFSIESKEQELLNILAKWE